MKNILIISEPNDFHALAVAWAISKSGHIAHFWFMADFPVMQSMTISNFETVPKVEFKTNEKSFNIENIDTVWMRRYYPPTISDQVHVADQHFARSESINTIRSACSVMAQACSFWVNPFNSNTIESKALQLTIASKVKFLIPPTIISNCSDDIRSFFNKHNQDIIHKSSMPMIWESKQAISRCETTRLSKNDLLDDTVLSACPGIFQAHIEKLYEVRVTVLGKLCIAVKLDSQKKESTIDWRMSLLTAPFPVEPIVLPEEIKLKIFEFMSLSNLLFGCFDFIISKSHEWIFLEVNPMGQFLWIEDLCPEIRLLQTFSNFLISKDPEFKNDNIIAAPLSLTEFENTAWEDMNTQLSKIHISPKNTALSCEG